MARTNFSSILKPQLDLTAEIQAPQLGGPEAMIQALCPNTQCGHILLTKFYCGAQVRNLQKSIDFFAEIDSWAGHIYPIFSHLAEKMCTASW